MRRLTQTLTLVLLTLVAASCAKAQVVTDPEILASRWKCSPSQPDIIIPVELFQEGSSPCTARVVPSGSGEPRGCRGKHVEWQITNKCLQRLKVTIAFSPFEKNSSGTIQGNGGTGKVKEKIRVNARATTPGGGCPSGAVCGPSYKYDIYIGDTLVLDPELEIEF